MVAKKDGRYYLYYAFEIKDDGDIVPRGNVYQQDSAIGSEQWENLSHALLFGSYDEVLIRRVAKVEHPSGMSEMSNTDLETMQMPRVYFAYRRPTKKELNELHLVVLEKLRSVVDRRPLPVSGRHARGC